MSASKRVLAKPKCRKEPITPEMLQLRVLKISLELLVLELSLCVLLGLLDFFVSVNSAVSVLLIFVFTLLTVLCF